MTGPSNCSFCVVLSSRGPVYGSGKAATIDKDGERYHSNCDCIAVPMRGTWVPDRASARGVSWRGDKVAGYDFDELYEREYKPFHRDNDKIGNIVDRREKAYRAWEKAEQARVRGYERRGGSLDQPTLQKAKWEAFRDQMDKKYEALPIEEWASAKPIPRRYVDVPIDWPADIPKLSVWKWNHILYGYDGGKGHLHGYGWVGGGTEFAKGQTPTDIAVMLRDALKTRPTPQDWIGTHHIPINGIRYSIHASIKAGTVRVNTFHRLEDQGVK